MKDKEASTEGAVWEPVARWKEAAITPAADKRFRLRLAAMSGHMAGDIVAARRAALIDLLAGGRPLTRESIWSTIEGQLDRHCWGKRPEETLQRDLRALRRGGVRIAYSRRPGAEGYYLLHPALERPDPSLRETINWQHVTALRLLAVSDKNQMAFELAEFALQQKRLLLARDQPDWPPERVKAEALRLVFES
jgi:hypothetical protein